MDMGDLLGRAFFDGDLRAAASEKSMVGEGRHTKNGTPLSFAANALR
jgi:hypothetical protein